MAENPEDCVSEMGVCLHCGDCTVYPDAWNEVPRSDEWPNHWLVLLRCGNCDTYREDIFSLDEVEQFDVWLDECLDMIKHEEKRFTKLNLSDEADRFGKMLELDVILPEDF